MELMNRKLCLRKNKQTVMHHDKRQKIQEQCLKGIE